MMLKVVANATGSSDGASLPTSTPALTATGVGDVASVPTSAVATYYDLCRCYELHNQLWWDQIVSQH